MLLYDFELIEPKKPASGDPSVTHLRLHFDERFALAPITDSTQTQTQEFATLEEGPLPYATGRHTLPVRICFRVCLWDGLR